MEWILVFTSTSVNNMLLVYVEDITSKIVLFVIQSSSCSPWKYYSIFVFTPMVLMRIDFIPSRHVIFSSLSLKFLPLSVMFLNLNKMWEFHFKELLFLAFREPFQFKISSPSLVAGNLGLLFLQKLCLFYSLCSLLLIETS